MENIYIFGVGKGKELVRRCLCEDKVHILGYVDNAAVLYPDGVDDLPVVTVKDMQDVYDIIVISVMKYEQIEVQLWEAGVDEGKIICFFKLEDAMKTQYWEILDADKWRMETLLCHYMQSVHYYLDNIKYEVADAMRKEEIWFPRILPPEVAIDRICREKVSLVRFGDGEFELLNRKPRPLFQKVDNKLAMKLEEVLKSKDDRILIAIANNYGSLNSYTESTANEIRKYMTKRVRQEHMALLDMDKEYYDAYISRPYLIYKDKENAGIRFECVKKIWDNRDVVLVEGEMTRTGVGNDLFARAASVQRILAPTEQAFEHYDEILKETKKQDKQKLFLIVLGPTATVLAYDLTLCGYQAIDIGQIDNEYEWYLRGVEERCTIPYKYVHRMHGVEDVQEDQMPDSVEKIYLEQIICRII
ncbi:MAG: GT-D fold domain-containing protein [Lachnospiraceae bacterium]|nr:GT-D fold domain-containing protein [Lachnospiraceae bacterium]